LKISVTLWLFSLAGHLQPVCGITHYSSAIIRKLASGLWRLSWRELRLWRGCISLTQYGCSSHVAANG